MKKVKRRTRTWEKEEEDGVVERKEKDTREKEKEEEGTGFRLATGRRGPKKQEGEKEVMGCKGM